MQNGELGNLRALTGLALEGWNEKKIFVLASAHNENTISLNKTNAGWQNILVELNKHCPVGLIRNEYGLSPKMVHRLITEAEQFLALIDNRVTEADQETVERCIQRVSDLIDNMSVHEAHIVARQIVGMLQSSFSFVPKEISNV